MTFIRILIFSILCATFSYVIYDSFQHIRAEYYHRNGFVKQAQGYLKQANRDYKKAKMLMPWETHYQLQLAKSYELSAKKYPNSYDRFINLAINEYIDLIKFDSINPWFKARLGLIYHDLYKKYKDPRYKELAYQNTKKTTENDPKNPLFQLHFAHLLYNYGKFDLAKQYYKKAIEYDDRLTEAHFNLAAIYAQEKNIDQVIHHYKIVNDQLIRLEAKFKKRPTKETKKKIMSFQHSRYALINYYLNNNQLRDAHNLIQLSPPSVEKYELLAKYYITINQKESAISIYKQLNTQLKTTKYTKFIKQLTK